MLNADHIIARAAGELVDATENLRAGSTACK